MTDAKSTDSVSEGGTRFFMYSLLIETTKTKIKIIEKKMKKKD
jgi:hypothetical protein